MKRIAAIILLILIIAGPAFAQEDWDSELQSSLDALNRQDEKLTSSPSSKQLPPGTRDIAASSDKLANIDMASAQSMIDELEQEVRDLKGTIRLMEGRMDRMERNIDTLKRRR